VQPHIPGEITCIPVWNVENRVAISIDQAATGKLSNTGEIMRIRGAAALTWGLHHSGIDTESRRG
jgi:hypothetical protein